MRVARLASQPRPCCTVRSRKLSRTQPRDKQVSFVPKVCSQCQTEQTDDESDATEEGIVDLTGREVVIERPAHYIETPETKPARAATTSSSVSKDHDGDNSVCIEIPKGASPFIMPPRQCLQPELSSTDVIGLQTPTLSSSSSSSSSCHVVSPPSKPLKSSLRTSSSKGKKARAGPTKRRVRGLWNENRSCLFSDLHDDILLSIMSHLSLDDLCVSSMVCRRWKHVTSLESAWKHVDATDLVRKTLPFHVRTCPDAAAEANSTALATRLQSHSPEKLTIRSIEHYLTADIYLPSLQGLQELTLTGFADFTDTHVHVMLLSLADINIDLKTNVNFEMKARGKKENVLRKLAIEQCPLLTNASIRSIAYNCPNLEELSLRGNRQMDDITPLKDMWKLEPQSCTKTSTSMTQPTTCMKSLFAPLQSPVVIPDRPSTPPPATASAGLASLFALPGSSPTRRVTTPATAVKPRKLSRVDFSNTKITAQALVHSFHRAPGVVELESIVMRGSGESWSDVHLKALSKTLSVSKLSTFDIGCANAFVGSTAVTDVGIESLFSTTAATTANATANAVTLPLRRLELAGHRSIQAAAIANILSAAIDLVEFDLETCKGAGYLSNKTGTIALGRALLQHGGGKGGLRRLSLARCFSSEKDSSSFTTKEFVKETKRGSVLLKALCKSPSSQTLEHIDMSGCWFVTASDEAMLRLYCKRLVTLRLGGTRSTKED
jgi:hypothetical protein